MSRIPWNVLRAWLAAALVALLATPPAWAGPKNPFSVQVEPTTLTAGQEAALRVTLQVPFGAYLYREMSEVTVLDAGGLELGEPDLPEGVMRFDENLGVEREVWEVDAVVLIPVKAAPAGSHDVLVQVRYQGCKEGFCFLPETEPHSIPVTVAEGKAGLGLPSLIVGEAHADDPPPAGGAAELNDENPVLVEVSANGSQLVVDFRQAEGWHCNAQMTFVELVEGSPFTLGEPAWPEAHERPDPAFEGMTRGEYDGDFTVTAEVTGPGGAQTVVGTVGYQACKAELCLIPQYQDFELEMALAGGAAPPAEAPEAAPVASAPGPKAEVAAAPAAFGGDAFSDAREKGMAWLVLFVFLAGVGVSFTPCVLPMVPITLGIIGASSSGSKLKAVGLASTYVLGLATVYTILMVASALTGSVFGTWMQSPVVVGAVSLFFFAMGGAMFGFFEVGVPSGLATRLNEAGGAGWKGSFVVGAVGAIVAGPCSGPVIAALMALIGQQGEVGLGVALGFVFSLGMGMIFIGSSLASDVLFRPGAWMDTVKKSFGVVMWLGAIYFVSAHLSDAVTALLTAGVLLSTAVFGWPPREEDDGYSLVPKVHKLYSVTGGLVGAYLLVGTLVTSGFILPPLQLGAGQGSTVAAATHGAISWAHSEPEGLARAAAEGKPMILDFTADWCAACKELEHLTYTDPRVISRAEGFVTVMIDATSDKDPEVARLFKKYGVSGLPNVLFIGPDGEVMQRLTLTGFEEADTFVQRMDAALGGGA